LNLLIVGKDYPPNKGGISTYTKELANALAKTCNVTVLAPGANNNEISHKSQPIHLIRTPKIPVINTLSFLIFIPWIIRRLKIDAIIHTVWPTALVSHLWYRLLPVPYFVSIHASEILDDKRTWRRRLKNYLKSWRLAALIKAKAIFPVSNYGYKIAISMGIKKEKIHVIPNGVNPDRFKPTLCSAKGKKPQKLLTVARLDLHKGHDHVLAAMAILKKQGHKPNYIIVGAGEEEVRLRRIANELGLSDQVKFMGHVPDNQLPEIYASADLFVMPCREVPGRLDLIEGFGISFLEASASGIPVIAGRSGGVSDAVRHGQTGYLVNPNNPQEIARAIEILFGDKELACKMGTEGRKWIEAEMSWDHMADQLYNVLQASL